MGMVLLPATAAMDEVEAALDAPVTRYEGVHDAVARVRAGDVVCVVVDAGATGAETDGAVRRLRREGVPAVVLAVDPEEAGVAIGSDVTAVVDRSTPTTTARTLGEVRADALFDRGERRSAGAETLVREATETVRSGAETALEPLADEVVASVGGTGPYPMVWVGQHDTERRVVRPLAAAGTPADHLRSVPVGPSTEGNDTDAGEAASVTRRAVTGDGGAAVFVARLNDADGMPVEAGGTHLVALRVPTTPVVVVHLVAERPGGLPSAERHALAALGSALAAAVEGDEAGGAGEDRLRLLADVLAHELSNQLGAASLQLDLAREHGDEEHFEHVARALDRLEGLTEETRALARPEPDLAWTDLESVTETAWDAISAPNATLEVEDATLEVDSALLRLALLNLLRNAVEHGGTGGGSDADGGGEAAEREGSDADDPSGLRVVVGPLGDDGGLYVADDGMGIPEAERERVLEWGHSGGDGTGVGLGLVRLVADRHGWDVAVEESDWGGARVALGPAESV